MLAVGSRIGPYEVKGPLGAGGLAWAPDGRSLVIAQARPSADIMLAERSQ